MSEENDVINEVSYLKTTIAKEINLRKRVKHPVIPGKFKMEKLPFDQLKILIRYILKPDLLSNLVYVCLRFQNVRLWQVPGKPCPA